MSAGKIQQVQRTSLICERPDTVFVAGFLGSPPMNLLRGIVRRGRDGFVFDRDGFTLPVDWPLPSSAPDTIVTLGIRPEMLRIAAAATEGFAGRVITVEPRGAEAVVTVESGPVRLKLVTAAVGRPPEGAAVGLLADPAGFVLFHGETGRRIAA